MVSLDHGDPTSTSEQACAFSARQQRLRVTELLATLPGAWTPFFGIQARTGIPPCALGPLLDELVARGEVETSDLGGYRLREELA